MNKKEAKGKTRAKMKSKTTKVKKQINIQSINQLIQIRCASSTNEQKFT